MPGHGSVSPRPRPPPAWPGTADVCGACCPGGAAPPPWCRAESEIGWSASVRAAASAAAPRALTDMDIPSGLEHVLHRELHDPGIADRGGDPAGGCAVERYIRVGPVH